MIVAIALAVLLTPLGPQAAQKAAPKAPATKAAPKAAAGSVPAGNYQCYGGSAGNMKLTFRGPGQYANEQGSAGAYAMNGVDITFTSGPWEGFYGRVLPDGRVGLSSRPNAGSYYMTCERK